MTVHNLDVLDKQNQNKVIGARAKALNYFPYLSAVVLRLPCVIVKGCPTAFITDKGVIGLGDDFVKKYTMAEVAATVLHEGFHFMWSHLSRRGPRDPELFNIAGDLVINETLRRMCKDNKSAIYPDGDMIYPEMYDYQWGDGVSPIPSVDEVYNDLMAKPCKPKNGQGQGQEQGQGKGPGHKGTGCGSGSGGTKNQWEEGLGAYEPEGGAQEVREALDLAAGAIHNNLKACGAGSADSLMWADSVGKAPRVDPLKLLRTLVGRSLAQARGRWTEPDWQRVNRRGYAYLPGKTTYSPEVTVIVDTSGSMWGKETGDAVLAQVYGMIAKLGSIRVIINDTAVTFDGKVKNLNDFKRVAKGGGGTELTAAFQAAENAKAIVVLTDGYLPEPRHRLVREAVWVVTPGGTACPFMAKVVKLDK